MRSCRVLPSSRRAVAVMAASGRSTRPATSQPRPIEASAIMARAMPDWARSWSRVSALSSLRTRCRVAGSGARNVTRRPSGRAWTNSTSGAPAAATSGSWLASRRSRSTLVPMGRVNWELTRA
ncbi:MAG TPA: hypothetical protein VL330_10460 [Actinomycetes bacterium]|nr:hypothetical protein [Actinomycetes bacterium]